MTLNHSAGVMICFGLTFNLFVLFLWEWFSVKQHQTPGGKPARSARLCLDLCRKVSLNADALCFRRVIYTRAFLMGRLIWVSNWGLEIWARGSGWKHVEITCVCSLVRYNHNKKKQSLVMGPRKGIRAACAASGVVEDQLKPILGLEIFVVQKVCWTRQAMRYSQLAVLLTVLLKSYLVVLWCPSSWEPVNISKWGGQCIGIGQCIHITNGDSGITIGKCIGPLLSVRFGPCGSQQNSGLCGGMRRPIRCKSSCIICCVYHLHKPDTYIHIISLYNSMCVGWCHVLVLAQLPGVHMLHSGVQLMGLESKAFDATRQRWARVKLPFIQDVVHIPNIYLAIPTQIDYSRKMNLLTSFGFILALNYVSCAAFGRR